MAEKDFKKYIESQARAAKPVLNSELLCANCINRDDDMPTCFCKVYKDWSNRKPNAVLLGKKDCPEYRPL